MSIVLVHQNGRCDVTWKPSIHGNMWFCFSLLVYFSRLNIVLCKFLLTAKKLLCHHLNVWPPLFPSFFTNINQWNTKFYSTFFFIMPMHHLQNNRAHTLSAACTFTKITKIKKLIYYTYRYVLLFFNMSTTIAVSNFGPGIFAYKLTYFVFLVPLLL